MNNTKELDARVQAEKKKTDERLLTIEKLQEKNIPKFNEICDEVKSLYTVVHSHHETRFTGIVADIDRLRDHYDLRFLQNEKMVDGVMKKIDKLEDKIDKIMDEIVKLNAKK